jgi:predicted transposase YbfD/YdcC
MMTSESSSLVEHFSKIKDPRIEKKCSHKLLDILVITVCATICRFDESWESIEDFANLKFDWLKKFLELPDGIPSHDTFRRVFLLLDPVAFQKCFYAWASSFREKIVGETIALDGKTSRGSSDISLDKKGVHMVSAWANENQMVLGQIKVNEKSNEITAIPELLELLDVSGCTVTIDAMGTQKEIAKKIIEKDADYVLGLKGNQETLHDDVKTYIDDQMDNKITTSSHQSKKTVDANHGRIEERNYHLFTDLDWLEQKDDWAGLMGIGMVESRIEKNKKISLERRYYITSLQCIDRFAKDVRSHWGIENSLHWSLDVSFNEDRKTQRKGNSPANSAVLRHIVMNLLKREKSKKISINRKRAIACMVPDYLEKVIFG